MGNFFGHGTGDAFYDKRRHLNMVFYSMMHLRFIQDRQGFAQFVKSLVTDNDPNEKKADFICSYVLSEYEAAFLNYLKVRYSIPESDYLTILAGETLSQNMIKTPASYEPIDNWRLIIQIIYSTMLSGPEYQSFITDLVKEFFIPCFSSIYGVKFQGSTYNLIANEINKCINNQGKTKFVDLPYIEQKVLDQLSIRK